jgi:hypothetical protein
MDNTNLMSDIYKFVAEIASKEKNESIGSKDYSTAFVAAIIESICNQAASNLVSNIPK